MSASKPPCNHDREFATDLLNQPSLSSIPFKHHLSRVWRWLEHVILHPDELKIWQKVNRHGQTICWQVFDPKSGRTVPFGSELEVRLWLERRFY